MPPPSTINQPKQLLVEGRSAVSFFSAFISYYNLSGFQIQDFGGIDELRGFLKALKNISGFIQIVTSLAIVRDAESYPVTAFQSVCTSLGNAGLPVPVRPTDLVQGPPQLGVYFLPDPTSSGMLETLCLRAVNADPVIPCVDEYFNCVNRLGNHPTNIDKARLQAYLASRSRPGLLLGQAAHAGYLYFGSADYESLRSFLSVF